MNNAATRLLILADLSSINADQDKALLNLYGYDAVTYFDLSLPKYRHNRGCVPTDRQLRDNIAVELLEGAIVVIHDDLSQPLERWVVQLCRVLELPAVPLAEVPFVPAQMTQERIDAANITGVPCYNGADTMPRIGTSNGLVVDPTYAHSVAMQPAPVIRHTNAPVAQPAMLRTWWQRAAHLFARMDRYIGDGLKNPMVREQQRAAQHEQPLATPG